MGGEFREYDERWNSSSSGNTKSAGSSSSSGNKTNSGNLVNDALSFLDADDLFGSKAPSNPASTFGSFEFPLG